MPNADSRSGKLILIQGWADQAVPPMGTLGYWHALGAAMGGDAIRDAFTRLFILPGVSHGRGLIPSDGPSFGDFVTPVMDWVESGIAPERLIMYSTAGPPMQSPVTRSRPVFPYPKVSRYIGTGSSDDPANFAPADPSVRYPDLVAGWADSFASGYEEVCAWQGPDFRCRKGK